jgi:hypothetical protein
VPYATDTKILTGPQTLVPSDTPTALSPEFSRDQSKQTQWRAFVNKSKLDTGGIGLHEVVIFLGDFLMPPTRAVAAGTLL